MIDLEHVLKNEVKICVLAKRFDFSDEVSVFCDGEHQQANPIVLHLMVKEIPGKSDVSRCSSLAVKLSAELGCKVEVCCSKNMPRNSALLSDKDGVYNLFRIMSGDEVKLKKMDREQYAEQLRDADHILAGNAQMLETEKFEKKRLKF